MAAGLAERISESFGSSFSASDADADAGLVDVGAV